ncbi:MAG TPA: hypothetical protein VEV84_15440 [Pyrinomonadaceae bacterium]|jgi:hypothetical protein|nr:hypothetical protein [Pyrinomonadaceae bacterium]
MKFDNGIGRKYRKSIEEALQSIMQQGNDEHRRVTDLILDSKMLIQVKPVSEVNASGVTGVVSPWRTRAKLDEPMELIEALGEVYICIAEETIDTGGQRGCEGTFVHEGRHAYDFAQVIVSLSEADINPLSIYDPTLYELEWNAHKTSGEYMLCVSRDEYIAEGLDLGILGREATGQCFVSDDGIKLRLKNNYKLSADGDQGKLASEIVGLR